MLLGRMFGFTILVHYDGVNVVSEMMELQHFGEKFDVIVMGRDR